MSQPRELALGLDLSTQQLKVVAVDLSNLETFYEKSVTFETDLKHFNTTKGVYVQGDEVYSPVEMWIEALDIILGKMRDEAFSFNRVVVISGAGQQHASVFWSRNAERLLKSMDSGQVMHEQLSPGAFSHPYSPNWQDHSTSRECQFIEEQVGGSDRLAEITGSRAHHRFTGPQILKFRRANESAYEETSRISLASSFFASLFLGKMAPIDVSDVCGMNLWDIPNRQWSDKLLEIVGGDSRELRWKLGEVAEEAQLGKIHPYFVERYGFSKDCVITPFTGDNPATIASLPLSPMDCIISLGTSTTLLLTTSIYKTSPAYHIFNHPITKGLYFVMLCYKNGSLAREQVRDKLNKSKSNDWDAFNSSLIDTPVLGGEQEAKLGFYFPLPEIIPDAPNGTWLFNIDSSGKPKIADESEWIAAEHARAIVESQALSMRLRARPLLSHHKPRHLYFVGGASQNSSIVSIMSQVLGSEEGVYRLTEGATAGACARGSAIKAAWAYCGNEKNFEDFVRERWGGEERLDKLGSEESESVWKRYGTILDAYSQCEDIILSGAR